MKTSKMFEATKVEDYKLLKVTSDAFTQNELIPSRYTCDGGDINPALHIEGLPADAKTTAIIVDDPDATGGNFCHWVIWDIPLTHQIHENENRGRTGINSFKQNRYNGPCPPSGVHSYNFKVYALNSTLNLPARSDKVRVEKALGDHIIAFGVLTGKYQRKYSSPA